MKVLICSPYLDISGVVSGGVNQWGRYMVSYYNEFGKVDVDLILSSFDRYLYLSSGDVPTWKRIWNGIEEQGSAVVKAKKLMKEEKPDVVHICTSAGLGLIKDLLLIKAAKSIGAKTAVHLHFGRTPELLNHNNWESKLIQRVLSSCDVAIAMNQPTMDALKEHGYSNARYLPNPLSLSIINQVKELEGTIKRIPNQILYVGHVARTKGVYELVEACTKISGVKLRIVGKCPDVDKENLLKVAGSTNETSWIEIVGEVSHDQVLREFFEAGIFVFPSYSEGFPNVILEAMACGCPIASSNVGAIPEMLDIDGDACGICFKPKSPEEVYQAISSLIDNDEMKTSFAAKAKARVNKLYAIPQVWGQMINIWNQSIEK